MGLKMHAQVKKLALSYHSHSLDPIWVILDQQSSPPILPLMFSAYLSRHGIVYEVREISDESSRRRITSLEEREVSDSTIRSYVYSLAKFLSYLEECRTHHQTPGMHASSACSAKFVNHYLNQVLANKLDSAQSLNTHRSALVAYYNWLTYMEILPQVKLRIDRKTRQFMAEKSNKKNYIQYVSRYQRNKLLNACETLAEKLMMRMGFEVGLRTSELMGLRISGDEGLLKLIRKLDDNEFSHVNQFRYLLKGRYTKGAKSRWIYFDRLLLQDMKRYLETERQWLTDQVGSKDDSFFLRTDQRFTGTGIGEEQASRVFTKRAKSAGLNPLLHFHDLRHTFATELFHAELAGPDGRETRSESAALIVVAQRLGHAFGRNGQAPPVTTLYVRMRLKMLQMEEMGNG
ncbi:tyrosine-type recombinase/integrase [uncultured Marinobacter sp.]|uniref:tyrosine-type recombinase/integrase n=1 Tax=uncultured Marinobacter sp. TaxID=187379 RepID=UPI0025826DAE|nr:tyrosine-type recombinase/integrase [uncultured Marinobacter sp.]